MKRRNWQIIIGGGLGFLAAAALWQTSFSGAQNPAEKTKAVEGPLPIRQVVLFNSGVGYFQREGEVVGNSRVDLTFPVSDINDLLKSLVLQDLDGGLISTVNYDSHDPIEKILRGFALDLNNNPSFGQILNQARGEKIEITRRENKETQPVKLIGIIVGMETQGLPVGKESSGDIEMLNLTWSNGLQSIPLAQVLGVKFLNPVLDNEFQRALKVLAAAHDTQKKLVTLGFNGTGKRAVRVGYVVERPIWKTSYRLRLEPNGKVFLQGWAMVENPSDDDWNDVRMVLVSAKPISYQMNLYEPLYIPRPLVESELFASLRPPIYSGALDSSAAKDQKAFQGFGAVGQFGQIGQFGFGGQFGQFGQNGFAGQIGQIGQIGILGTGPSNLPIGGPVQLGQFGQLGFGQVGQIGQSGGVFQGNRYQQNPTMNPALINNRLTYQELQQRRVQRTEQKEEAKSTGSTIAGMNYKEGIQSVAAAEEVGDYFQYVLDQKITLSRQKSALVPILDQTIEGTKVSIYNESTHAKFPLLGLRLKNTSGKPLTQGPITVYDSGNYAGDTRILNLQPDEERFLSYALDQGTEIKTEIKAIPSSALHLRLDQPKLTARYIMRETKTYTIKNRSAQDRSVILEHPIRADWKLVGTKPSEQSRDVYRFTVAVPAGKSASLEVAEEQPRIDQLALAGDASLFAARLGFGVKVVNHSFEDKLIEVKVQTDMLSVRKIARESRTIFVQNLSDQDREFTIDHVVRPGWKLLNNNGESDKKGSNVFRFKLVVLKGKTQSQEMIEEQPVVEQIAIRPDGKPQYPLGLGLALRTETHSYENRLVGLKIQKGMLLATNKMRTSQTYIVQNESEENREFLIDHPVRPEWVLLDEGGETQKSGPDVFRFKLSVPKGKSASKELKEETIHKGKGKALKEMGETTLREYLAHPMPSAEVKAALAKFLQLVAKVEETTKNGRSVEKQLDDLTKDQARLRSNLQIIPQSSEHYKTFLEKFVAQETAIENLQRQVRQLQTTLQTQEREYQAFITNLHAE